jgi:urease subunit beta/urease subunit gamma/beta
MIPGEIIVNNSEITLNAGRGTASVRVSNTGDRPVQVGSHFHFFEVNRCLRFDRKAAFGMRLDIPSGTSVRFEPGETKAVNLTEAGGRKRFFGLNGLTNGPADAASLEAAMSKALDGGFIQNGVGQNSQNSQN